MVLCCPGRRDAHHIRHNPSTTTSRTMKSSPCLFSKPGRELQRFSPIHAVLEQSPHPALAGPITPHRRDTRDIVSDILRGAPIRKLCRHCHRTAPTSQDVPEKATCHLVVHLPRLCLASQRSLPPVVREEAENVLGASHHQNIPKPHRKVEAIERPIEKIKTGGNTPNLRDRPPESHTGH